MCRIYAMASVYTIIEILALAVRVGWGVQVSRPQMIGVYLNTTQKDIHRIVWGVGG
jgi:hypothetical protein